MEVKSDLPRATVPPAIRDLLGRDDVRAAAVLNDRLRETVEVGGKPVLFLPHALAHTLPGLLRG